MTALSQIGLARGLQSLSLRSRPNDWRLESLLVSALQFLSLLPSERLGVVLIGVAVFATVEVDMRRAVDSRTTTGVPRRTVQGIGHQHLRNGIAALALG